MLIHIKVKNSFSLLQIAPTIAAYFHISLDSPARPIKRVLEFAYARYPAPHTVVLLVVDSLDIELYYELGNEFSTLHRLAEQNGFMLECETVSNHTTPAIASILTGLRPESHGILTSADAGRSTCKSILEQMEEQGRKAGVVIEEKGTEPLIGRLSGVYGISDREDIVEYDRLITEHTISMLNRHQLQLIFSHIRTIDRFAHRGWDLHLAARITDRNIGEIADAVSGIEGLLLICGDHQAHLNTGGKGVNRKEKVPLIVAAPPKRVQHGTGLDYSSRG